MLGQAATIDPAGPRSRTAPGPAAAPDHSGATPTKETLMVVQVLGKRIDP